jgi:predicted dehydrogenase
MFKIAVLGAGAIGVVHAELVNRSELASLTAIVDPSGSSEKIATSLGTKHYSSLDALLSNESPDGVIIATPNKLHIEQAIQCIKAEIAVLIEKPIAENLESALFLLEGGLDLSRVLVGHHRAYSPIVKQARTVIQSGEIGSLVAVTGSAAFYKPDSYFSLAPWRAKKGAGPILINLIHEIGNLRSICGEIEAVQSISSNSIRGNEVEDTAAILIRFVSGVLGTFILSDCAASPNSWEQTSGENPQYANDRSANCYTFMGTLGSLEVPTMKLRTVKEGDSPSWFQELNSCVLERDLADPLEKQFEHFCDVIAGEKSAFVSVHDGIKNLAVIDAVNKSIETHKIVYIQDLMPLPSL